MIAAASIPTPELPDDITKRLPRYPTLPAVRIGRLAVDVRFKGSGLGGAPLADAVRRVLLAPPAVFALLVDAKDDQAVAFYQHYGFQTFASQPATDTVSFSGNCRENIALTRIASRHHTLSCLKARGRERENWGPSALSWRPERSATRPKD